MFLRRILHIGVVGLIWAMQSHAAYSQDEPSLKELDDGYGVIFPEGPDIMWPAINPQRGRMLFASKGCVICHSVNGVGGQIGPAFDALRMPPFANPLEFAARMFRGAPKMIELQQRDLGYQTDLTGQELADIVGFVHDKTEQRLFTEDDIPPEIERLMPFQQL